MIEKDILKNIGLNESEIKVYLALLKIGESKKDSIVKESRISSSKIYDVTWKLAEKGLVSIIIKNGIKHFKAAPPETLIEVINKKRISLEKKEDQLKKLIPTLNKIIQERVKKEIVEMYVGWRGLETLYGIILNDLKRGQTDFVLGATTGIKTEKTERFYVKINRKLKEKGIKLNILFGKKQRSYAKRVSKKGELKYYKVKYLDFDFPTEINIFNDNVAIIILLDEPISLLIRNKLLAESFKSYFAALWKIAKE